MLESVFNEVAGFRAYNFITKKLQDRCFPVKYGFSLFSTMENGKKNENEARLVTTYTNAQKFE